MTITNLSFETQGTEPGEAASWLRTVGVPFFFESFETTLYVSRFEGFELGWGVDDFIDALVVPTNALQMDFGTIPPGGVVTPYDDFERGWRLPNSHGLVMSGLGPFFGAAPPFIGYPYGLTAPFALFNGATLDFTITDAQGVSTPVTCTFLTSQFVDITHARAIEVVHAINLAIGAAYDPNPAAGFAYFDAFGHVFITTVETGGPHTIEGGATGTTAAVVSKIGNVVTLDGFPNLNDSFVGLGITFTGAASGGNNLTTPIVSVDYTSPGQWSMTINNPSGVAPDANNGTIDWTIAPETSAGCSIVVSGGSTALAALGWVAGTFAGGVDAEHPGDETASFIFDSAESAVFSVAEFPPSGVTFDGFEAGWPVNQIPFYLVWSAVPSSFALFNGGTQAFENFEQGWNNTTYYDAWSEVTASSASFNIGGSLHAFESFEAVFVDETVAPDFTSAVINDVATAHSNTDKVTIYAGTTPQGNFGLVPTGLNPLITYFVINKTTNSFQLSLTSGGGAVFFSDNGTAPVFIKADITKYWTQTNVGI